MWKLYPARQRKQQPDFYLKYKLSLFTCSQTDVQELHSNSWLTGGTFPCCTKHISGPAGSLQGQTGVVYSVVNVPGDNYIWTLPPGNAPAILQHEFNHT